MSNAQTAIARIKDAKRHINYVIGMLSVLQAADLTSDDPSKCDDTSVSECAAGGEELLFAALRESDAALKALGVQE